MATEIARLTAVFEARTVALERAFQRAIGSADRSAARIQRRFREMNRHLERSFSGVGRIAATAFAGLGVGLGTRELQQAADSWINLGNKIRAAGVPMEEVAAKQEQLFQLAQESRAGIEETIGLYQRLKIATTELGTADEDVIRLTETITKSMQAAGATTQEAAAAALQLGQALGSGVLQGDELRSIRENAPLLAQAIAREFGVTVGELKTLGAEGRLTADRIIRAILSISDETDAAFASLRRTGGQALQQLSNAWTRYVGKIDEALGATDGFTSAIDRLTAFLTSPEGIQAGVDFATALAEAFEFAARNIDLLVTGAAAFVAVRLATALYAAAAAVKALTLSLASNPLGLLVVGATAAVGAIVSLTDALGITGDEAEEMASKIQEATDALERLADAEPDLRSVLAAIEDGSFDAATALDEMSAAAKRALIDLARLKSQEAVAAQQPLWDVIDELRRQRDAYSAVQQELINISAGRLADLRRSFEAGTISVEQLDAGIAEVRDSIANLGDEAIIIATRAAAAQVSLDPLRDRVDYWFEVADAAEQALITEREALGAGGTGSGSDGGGARASERESALLRYLEGLREESRQLSLNGIALEQRRALLEASAAAQEDFENGLRSSAQLTAAETDEILRSVQALAAVPEILSLAAEDPIIATQQRLRELQDLQAALSDPAVMDALIAQGLTAEQAYAAVENAMRQAEMAGSTIAQLVEQASQTIASGFGDLITQGAELTDVIQRITEALIEMIAQALILAPLQQALGGFAGSLFGGGVVNAKGNAFLGGRVIPFARGGVVSSPTVFPMAKGMGLMGEAGPEAILPLARGRGGELGVKAQGVGGGAPVTVQVIDQRSAETSQPAQVRETAGPGGQRQIEIMIQDAVERVVRRGGIDRALGDSYGLTRRGRR